MACYPGGFSRLLLEHWRLCSSPPLRARNLLAVHQPPQPRPPPRLPKRLRHAPIRIVRRAPTRQDAVRNKRATGRRLTRRIPRRPPLGLRTRNTPCYASTPAFNWFKGSPILLSASSFPETSPARANSLCMLSKSIPTTQLRVNASRSFLRTFST